MQLIEMRNDDCAKVEAEKLPEVAERYDVKAVPYFVFLLVRAACSSASPLRSSLCLRVGRKQDEGE